MSPAGLRYDPPGAYTTKIPAGVAAFRRAVAEHFGIEETEVVRDKDRCDAQASEHCAARAVDAFTADLALGRRIFEWAIDQAPWLGVQSVIFNRRVWGFGDWSERRYTGKSPHTDHVHIGLNLWAAENLTPAMVRARLGEEDFVLDADNTARLVNMVHAFEGEKGTDNRVSKVFNDVEALRAEVQSVKSQLATALGALELIRRKLGA